MADNYKIQTLIFDKSKYSKDKAEKFIKKHGYKNLGVDEKEDTFRYRQIDPDELKKEYPNFRTIHLGKKIKAVVGYKRLKGGKMTSKQLKGFINQSYEDKPQEQLDGYILDKELSNKTAKIYHNPETGEAVVAHRGTKGARDWLNNLAYATGLYEKTDRYKRGKKAQESAEKKYGKENISTVGHSQGAVLARKLGKDTKEIINVNPAYLGEKQRKNETVIRSKKDIVSGLIPTAKKKERNIEIKPEKKTNILKEHSPDILDRLDNEMMIGKGRKKKTVSIPKKSIFKGMKKVFKIKRMKGGSNSQLKVYQIKAVIEQWLDKNKDKKLKGWKTAKKDKLLKLLDDNNINPAEFNIPQKNPKPSVRSKYVGDVLKKYGKRKYTEPEQESFLMNLSSNTRHKNPLQPLEQYINKEGKKEYVSLEKHQKDFIKQFIYSNLRGAIAFHGVGSGKTLSAVVSSYLYLKMYPKNKVIVITPSALLYNFINGMVQYGLDISDNRYSFYTYEKYVRNPVKAQNALLIVDEAHNFRTQIQTTPIKDNDEEGNEVITGEEVLQNRRGYKLMKFGSEHAHKVLLLTGTAFVNSLYDIENLLAMVDNRPPITPNAYEKVVSNGENMEDYFNYKISYFKTSPTSIYFPKMRDNIVPIYMNEEQEKEYDQIKQTGPPYSESDKPNNFYNAEMYASNMIDGEDNPKMEWIVDKVRDTPDQKFIIYSTLYDSGVKVILNNLDKLGIKYTTITGSQSTSNKEENKRLFNGYNFGNPNFFKIEDMDENLRKYVNDKYRVLVITKAGAEGVDTINCQNVILVNSLWNDALGEQIIARAIRFKSHFGLPEKERYVNVYRLLLARERNKEIIDVLQNPDFKKFCDLKKELKEEAKKYLELMKMEDGDYLPTVKELKELTYNTKEGPKPFIPDITKYTKKPLRYGGKHQQVQDGPDGWDKYKEIDTKYNLPLEREEARKKWRNRLYSEWWAKYGNEAKEKNPLREGLYNSTADILMYILAKSKTENIEDFCNLLGNKIELFEKFQSALLPRIIAEEKEKGRQLTDEEQAEIYAELLKDTEVQILGTSYKPVPKEERTREEQLQEYFTNEKLAEYILTKSSIRDKEGKIEVLEPTCGDGALIRPILKLEKDITIDMIELNRKNREILKDMESKAPNTLFLQNQPNFLRFIPSKRYDYIFTNPPFHLRKSENAGLLKDTWDFDFVKRAFAMLKVGGELVAITGSHYKSDQSMIDWYNDESNKKVTIETKKGESFKPLQGRAIKIDIDVIKIVKTHTNEDSDILDTLYYKVKNPELGQQILDNEVPITDVIKPSKNIKMEFVKASPEPDESLKDVEELDKLFLFDEEDKEDEKKKKKQKEDEEFKQYQERNKQKLLQRQKYNEKREQEYKKDKEEEYKNKSKKIVNKLKNNIRLISHTLQDLTGETLGRLKSESSITKKIEDLVKSGKFTNEDFVNKFNELSTVEKTPKMEKAEQELNNFYKKYGDDEKIRVINWIGQKLYNNGNLASDIEDENDYNRLILKPFAERSDLEYDLKNNYIKYNIEKQPRRNVFEKFNKRNQVIEEDEEEEIPAPPPKPELTETQKKKLSRFFEKARFKVSTKNEIKKVEKDINDKITNLEELKKQFNNIDPDDEYEAIQEAQSKLTPPKKTKGKISFGDIEATLENKYKIVFNDKWKKGRTAETLITELMQQPKLKDLDKNIIDSLQFRKMNKDVEDEIKSQYGKIRVALAPISREIEKLEKMKKELEKKLKNPNYKEVEILKDLKRDRENLKKKEKLLNMWGTTTEELKKKGINLDIQFGFN